MINLRVNNYKEVLIQTVDIAVVVLSFGYANIVKDAGVETFFCGIWTKRDIF